MKRVFKIIAVSAGILLLISCASKNEKRGNAAYKAAQKASGAEKAHLQKKAYIFYKKAVDQEEGEVSTRLKNRFLDMLLIRANMVLTEGSTKMDALPLFMEELDKYIEDEDVETEIKDRYSDFFLAFADSCINQNKIKDGVEHLEKAKKFASNKQELNERMDTVVHEQVELNLAKAKDHASMEDDQNELIKAEFFTKLALYYDSTDEKAQELLSDLRKKNLEAYSAYERVLDDSEKPDSTIYDKINQYPVFFAITDKTVKGNSVTLIASMYNYSWNPLKLLPSDFKLVDTEGNEFKGLSSSNLKADMLDQEEEVRKMVLKFKKGSAKIKKLVYDRKDIHGEKYFF
ncbi:MAG: hypothetical protein ACOCSE_03695 [Chitinivibrionales bacterium]